MSHIGERIRQARTLAGLSLRELAAKVGVSAQAISKYENGQDIPGSGVLLRLAHALSVKVEFFVRPKKLNISSVEFRKKSGLPSKEEQKILQQVAEWLERYLEVESLCNVKREQDIPDFSQKVASLEDCETAANALRVEWNLGDDPIPSMMILLEDRGIKVRMIDAHGDFDAMAVKANDCHAAVLNESMPADRQKLSLAHELGHIVCPNPKFASSQKEIEKVAFRFGAAFLVPKSRVLAELGPSKRRRIDPFELHLLKHKYGLSMLAWIYRAKDVGILSESDATAHFRDFSARGWRKREPGDELPAEEKSRRFDTLVLRLYSERIVSNSRLSELLGKPFSEFEKDFKERHGSKQSWEAS